MVVCLPPDLQKEIKLAALRSHYNLRLYLLDFRQYDNFLRSVVTLSRLERGLDCRDLSIKEYINGGRWIHRTLDHHFPKVYRKFAPELLHQIKFCYCKQYNCAANHYWYRPYSMLDDATKKV